MAGLTWPVTVLPGFGGAFGPEERQFEPTVRRPSPLWAESRPGLCGCACQQAPAAAQVVGHGPEPDLQTGSGEPEPTHAPQAVAALPGPEHLLNPSPDAPAHDRPQGGVGLQG